MKVRKPKRVDWVHSVSSRSHGDIQKEMRIWMRTSIGAGKQLREKRGPEQLSPYHMWYYRITDYPVPGGSIWRPDATIPVTKYYFINSMALTQFLLRWSEEIM